MKRTTITMDGGGRVAVPSDAANVWMSEMELVTLFDVIVPTLRAAIRAIYRNGVLKPCEVERRIRLSSGYYAEVYALPMVVALAFRAFTQPKSARRSTIFSFFGLFLFAFEWWALPIMLHFLITRFLLRRSASFYVSRF